MEYAIDGNNVLLGLRLNDKPSVRLFARLLQALQLRSTTFRLFFDHSIRDHMAREGLTAEWEAFSGALSVADIAPVFAGRADSLIDQLCQQHSARVLNFSDKLDSWKTTPNQIHRVQAICNGGTVELRLIDNATGTLVLAAPAHGPFEFGGIQFPDLNPNNAALERLIAPAREAHRAVHTGVLLVLALDASQSMSDTNTYDGRSKSDHLNEIVKSAIERLARSTLSEGLYIAILRFEEDVTPLRGPSGTIFSHVYDWHENLATFNYLQGITLRYTNIRLALQRSRELLQNTISDDASLRLLADVWRAAVIVITDGNHVVMRGDGSYETDDDVAGEALNIHMGISGLTGQRIDVGCVGIGNDVKKDLLLNIASPCTPIQSTMAARARIDYLLCDNRLCMLVDSNDARFDEAIRTFIDIVSSR